MNIEDVRQRVAACVAVAEDPGEAHAREDMLWAAVLAAIAKGAPNPQELAREALKTNEIDFPRWYS